MFSLSSAKTKLLLKIIALNTFVLASGFVNKLLYFYQYYKVTLQTLHQTYKNNIYFCSEKKLEFIGIFLKLCISHFALSLDIRHPKYLKSQTFTAKRKVPFRIRKVFRR